MRRLPLLLLAPLALLAASCGGGGGSSGGGGSLSKGDVAVVDGTHISRAQLDGLMAQAKCGYEARKAAFPKPGTDQYQTLQAQALQFLVRETEFTQQAPKVGASVSDKQVEARLKQIKKTYFGNDEKKYRANLKKSCTTDADYKNQLRAQLLSEAIYSKLTKRVTVSDADVRSYYIEHAPAYSQPQTRVVRHILVKTKALADRLYAQLKHGADFAALAKKYSTDPGSKAQGGKLTIQKGQTVHEFDVTAFALKTGQISKPVHTQYGWHIIQALKNTTPRKSTPYAQVKQSIRQQLLQQEKGSAAQTWLQGVEKDYASKITYATGFAPPTTTSATTTG